MYVCVGGRGGQGAVRGKAAAGSSPSRWGWQGQAQSYMWSLLVLGGVDSFEPCDVGTARPTQ